MQRVAYQGAPGAYSEGAALKAVPDGEPLPCEQFEVAFQALSQWLAERAVLPIENSVGGSIHTVYDLLHAVRGMRAVLEDESHVLSRRAVMSRLRAWGRRVPSVSAAVAQRRGRLAYGALSLLAALRAGCTAGCSWCCSAV